MKFTTLLAQAALAVALVSTATQACNKVSVVGDATYCIDGPVCSGTPAKQGGDKCPQVGDTAVADCQPYFPAYNKATGKCTAPVPADCKPIASGVWGCVWDLSKLPGAPAPAPTTVAPAPGPVVTPAPAPTTAAPKPDCNEVTVVGDGLFCIKGGPVCSGLAANKGGEACPQVGDTATAGCNSFNPSYVKATGKCTAPVPAVCQPTNGVWACNWDLSKLGL